MKDKKRIEFDEKCKSCGGTGLYSGMGESPECAVVCSKCKGTGCFHFVYEYEYFKGRIPSPKIKHVYETNPGIKVGDGGGYKFKDFGGMPYKDWNEGKPFVPGMENRQFTCPAWWYQSTNYDLKPDWNDEHRSCKGWGGSFSQCAYFEQKEGCWERWDKEHPEGK